MAHVIRFNNRSIFRSLLCLSLPFWFAPPDLSAEPAKVFRAGAYAIDVTPQKYPVHVAGMFTDRTTDTAFDPLHARCLVLDDGTERLAIVVVDSCMMPRDLLDRAKDLAHEKTGIRIDRMLISATHTHSAPSAMGCLGCPADTNYVRFLPGRIAEGIERAAKHLAPAHIGWGVIQDFEHTYCRRWIRRPDKMLTDPWGERSVRAHMHPGHQNPDAIAPAGPVDPDLSILSVQTPDGRPLALLANYSMHYYDSPMLSADYFGRFAAKIGPLIGAATNGPAFVGMMSQGTSGDQMWMNYGQPAKKIGYDAYASELAHVALEAYRKIQHHTWVPLKMAEAKLTLNFRQADEQRLAGARTLVAAMNGRLPRTLPEVYAYEAIYLHERPTAELKLQALRIGELGIAAIPNEVFAITGLKIKAQSPLQPTFNIELANGAEGYIPPPEQHKLGGYTTWAARTAGLEPSAEPRIVETVLALLEEVSGQPRRPLTDTHGTYAQAILESQPLAYWRLSELAGPAARDATRHGHRAVFEDGVAFHLEGPASANFSGDQINRAAHFAGGRLRSAGPKLGDTYSVELWFWNGLPKDVRPVTGYFFSRGAAGDPDAAGDHLGIGGTHAAMGRLLFFNGNKLNQILGGVTEIKPKTWNHVVLVRDGQNISVYLNGNAEPEISGHAQITYPDGLGQIFIGGRNDNFANFEGKIDEVAVYDRALKTDEITRHYRASGLPAKTNLTRLKPAPPKSPAESLQTLHVKPGFAVELVAAEPLVLDPVAMDWGADGKLWIAEMADYPMGLDGKMKPGGRIRVLEDSDGDGHYDKSVVFLDGVRFPNGVLTWRKGVIVTAAPEIFYAEDTDGDGQADVRKTLFTGFKEGNLQLRVNSLRWGLDNWIYCANGWSGGTVQSVQGGTKVDLSGRDIRIRPDDGLIDLQSGVSQFGRNPNDWGDWFGVDNSHPLFHYPLPDHYTRRNPHLAAPDPKVQVIVPANPKVFQRSEPEKRYHSFEHLDRFTSACSSIIQRDDWLFGDGRQHVFICEPYHNLVQHQWLFDDGVTFSARRADDESDFDFLASEDGWFRPSMVRTGPDGALWIADMYRYMIEHPDWLPADGKAELEPFFRLGDNQGRLYRVFPKGRKPPPLPRLDKLNPAELASMLESANGWIRDKAQQMLIWSADISAVAPLETLAARSRHPLARLHALCTLDGIGALQANVIEAALRDEHAGVRRHAVRLAETRALKNPQLIAAAARLADDPDAKVRLQLACTLGEWDDPRAGLAIGRLAVANHGDRYIIGAVMSSAVKHNAALVNEVLAAKPEVRAALTDPLLSLALSLNQRDAMARLLTQVLNSEGVAFTAAQMQTFSRFADLLPRKKTSLAKLMADSNDSLSQAIQRSAVLFAEARRSAADPKQPIAQRAAAAGLLGREPASRTQDLARLGALLTPQTPVEVQQAVVKSLGSLGDAATPALLTQGWPAHAPGLRAAILDALIAREPWAFELLQQIESGLIAPQDFDAPRRERLIKHHAERIKTLAKTVFKATTNRQTVLDEFRPALALKGDARRGADLFTARCAACHKVDGHGKEIGPDLRAITDHSPEGLLVSILDPSSAVEPRYLAYTASLASGEELYGLIASETGNSLTLKLADDSTRTLLRGDLASLRGTKVSLMPEGLEAGLSKQDFADLIHFLQAPTPTR